MDAHGPVACHRDMRESDQSLVAAAKAGSRDAASELFSRHWDDARRVALATCRRRAMADDVAQDAMVQAFAALETFRGEGPFGAWLRRIVVTRALNALRDERRLVPLDDADAPVWDEPHVGDAGLARAVSALPHDQRIAVQLRYGADLTPPEIADALGVAVGTVHSRLARALAGLRTALEVADA